MALKFNFKEAVKNPWVKWSLILLGMIAVFMILKRVFGGGSTATTDTASQQADLQAESALMAQQTSQNEQTASINAQSASQTSAQSAQLALQQEQDSTALATQKMNDDSSLALAGVQLSGLQDQLSTQATMQDSALNTQIALSNITATEQEQIAAGQNALVANVQQSNNATQTALANIMAGVQTTVSNNQTGVAIEQSNNQTAVNLAQTNAAVQISAGNNSVSKTVSSNQTSASKTSTIAGLATVALALFSDRRLKENIELVGKTVGGHNIYTYNYIGDPRTYMGVIAQEALSIAPDAVIETESGYLAVDYSKIH